MLRPLARSRREEWLDRPHPDPAELRVNFEDLRRINRWWGGNRSTLAALAPPLDSWPRSRALRVLEVGSGGGDLLMALARRCRNRGITARLVGVDRCRVVIEIARQHLVPYPEILLLRGDGLRLPFPPGTFDFVVCSLVLHHIPAERAAEFLRGLGSLAREGVVVSDLRRGRLAYAITLLFARLLTRGRMTRADAPLSVLRSLTLSEARDLARRAGWERGSVRRSFPLRFILLDRPLPR